MKKITAIFVLYIATTLLIYCGSSSAIQEPNAVGTYAFKILKDFKNVSEQAFLNKLLTYESLQETINKEGNTIADRTKNEFKRMTKEDYNSRITRDYDEIKAKAEEFGIVWNQIEYVNYTSKEKTRDGIKGSDGKLYFSHNGEKYTVTISAMDFGNGYSIIELERLRKDSGDNY